MNVKVSIVIATYNRVDKLSKCLEKIFDQDYLGEYEVIIVDDGSKDSTLQLLEKLSKLHTNLRYFTQRNSGPAKARNLGIKKAQGEYVFFTDDDVLVPKDWITSFVNFLDNHSDVAAVGGSLEASEETRKKNIFARYEKYFVELEYPAPKDIQIGGYETYGVMTCTVAYRKGILNEIGGFDEGFPFAAGEDADLKLRVTQKYYVAYIPSVSIHIQDYNLKRFIKQSYVRGVGSLYFENKWRYLLNSLHNKKKYNSIARYDLPLIMLKTFMWDMLFIFMIGVITSRYSKYKNRKVFK